LGQRLPEAKSFLAAGTRPPSFGHTYIRVVQRTDCLGMFASVSPSLQAARNALRRIHCGVRRVPNHHCRWQRFLVGQALRLIILCHSNTPIIPIRLLKQLGMPKPDLPLNQRLPDFLFADSIRQTMPSSLAPTCLEDKAERLPRPRRSKSVTGKTLPEHGP